VACAAKRLRIERLMWRREWIVARGHRKKRSPPQYTLPARKWSA
jgi:hypothetical protein